MFSRFLHLSQLRSHDSKEACDSTGAPAGVRILSASSARGQATRGRSFELLRRGPKRRQAAALQGVARRRASIGLLVAGLAVTAVAQIGTTAHARSLGKTGTAAQTYSISGRVTDGFGNGISGATVTLSGTQADVTVTDSAGNYSFSNLAEGGNYILSPSKAGQYSAFAASVSNLSGDVTKNLRLDPYIRADVRVADGSGNGIAGVGIQINSATFGLPQTNSLGNVSLALGVAATGNTMVTLTPQKPGYTFVPSSWTLSSDNGNQAVAFRAVVSTTPPSFIQFSASSYSIGEGDGSARITVTRTGDTSSAASVFYFTGDAGVATQKRDYTMAGGMLNFAAGETSKKFTVLITENAYVQGTHTLFLQLSSPTGGAFLGSPNFVTLGIADNDVAAPTTNPVDDAQSFVRQHYADFLNRVPDQEGLDYWIGELAKCGTDVTCLRERRIGISAAFFVEQEFQQTGFVIYRLNSAALGMIPSYTHFMVERGKLIGGAQLEASTSSYANEFVQGGAFANFYPAGMTPADFVNKLFDTAGLTGASFVALRDLEIQSLTDGSKTRAQVLLDVIEIPEFKARAFNPAFVLMQYYGYLRRDPEPDGYGFWLNVLNNKLPNDMSGYRAMVCGFLTSAEYQDRFSPVRTHSNGECGP
jgi:Calx-beta domain/Carboxypeptidase regulatory-like domain/Domain of unknown function (DUF4214)